MPKPKQEDPLDIGEPEAPQDPNRPTPIGVPLDYRTKITTGIPRETGPVTGWKPPLYFDGDELTPSQLSPDKIADLQRQLVAAGLIRPGARLGVGVWDEVSMDAFYRLLGYSNQNGLNWKMALNRILSSGQQSQVDEFGNIVPIGGPGAENLVPTRTTPPEELRQVFRAAVIETLGQGWNNQQIDAMVGAYHQMEISRQRDAISAEGTTNNVVGIPSPESFAVSQATEANPGRAQAEQGLGFANQFMSLIGRWSNG